MWPASGKKATVFRYSYLKLQSVLRINVLNLFSASGYSPEMVVFRILSSLIIVFLWRGITDLFTPP